MASFDVFYSFFIIKTNQEWGRTWYNPWQSKIEAKLHEESKFWRASKPLPNQSSMQGRESEKKSNTEEFCNLFSPFAKFLQARRNFRNSFSTLQKFHNSFSTLQNFHNSISNLRNLHVIFRYLCTDSVRFLPQDILCNYIFSPCNQLNIFLDI